MIADAVASWRRAQEKRLALTFAAPGTYIVLGNAELLRQLFSKLVENAIKFTETGGVNESLDGRPHRRGGGSDSGAVSTKPSWSASSTASTGPTNRAPVQCPEPAWAWQSCGASRAYTTATSRLVAPARRHDLRRDPAALGNAGRFSPHPGFMNRLPRFAAIA